jgi:hypothetical protein
MLTVGHEFDSQCKSQQISTHSGALHLTGMASTQAYLIELQTPEHMRDEHTVNEQG